MSKAITLAGSPRHSPSMLLPQLDFTPVPKGAGAVMAGHAPAVVEGDDDRTALLRGLNYFPTPPWAARAGGELVRALDPEARAVWEPACGEGHMAGPLGEMFPTVRASDVHDYGFGEVHDFLAPLPASPVLPPHAGGETGAAGRVGSGGPKADDRGRYQTDWVITNPPFSLAGPFAARGMTVARRGVALLCRLAFVESVGRYPLMSRKALTAPFAERVPMQLGSWNPDLSSATAYAWFVWMTPEAVAASPLRAAIEAAWSVEATLERIIPPGTKARLTRADDRAVYAARRVEKAQPSDRAAHEDAGGARQGDLLADDARRAVTR